MTEWFEAFDIDLWLKADETGEEDAPFILNALALQPGDRVLDAPCGAGRISLPLARAGCRLTCVDLQPGHIVRAEKRFADEKLNGEFVVGDLRKLDYDGVFDAVINWGGSFGYFSDAVNADVLARLARALKPGGRLLIDQRHREFTLRHFRYTRVGEVHSQQNRWDAATQRVEGTWTVHDPAGERTCFSTVRLYTPAQFRRLFTRAGLTWEAAYSGIDGSPLTRGSRRMYVAARKP
ncbi:MAG: class I SAM-dependent methyltransferase [Armatimonadota bacterium]